MNEPVKKKRALAPRKKAPATNKKELEKNNLNVSGGRLFYERAASRRSRHRDALKNRETFPLKRSSSISDKTKKRKVFTDVEEEEERMKQTGKMRVAKISWAGGKRPSSIDRAKISRAATTVRSSPVTLSRSQGALAQKSVVQQGSKDTALLPHKPLSKKRARSHNLPA